MRYTRRVFLKYGMESLALSALASVACTEELTFERAKKDHRLRQRYIDQIVGYNPPPVDVPIVYNHNMGAYPSRLFPSSGFRMQTFLVLPAGSSEAKVEKIELYRSSFEELFSEDEILSGLVDHEYVHVRRAIEGILADPPIVAVSEFKSRVLNPIGDLFDIFFELDAYSHQIKEFSKRSKIRNEFKASVFRHYSNHRKLVQDKPRTPLTEWMLNRYP